MDERYSTLGGLRTCLVSGPWDTRLRIVFLHGMDMQPSDLTPFAHSLAIPGVSYAFPEAPLATSARGRSWWPRLACETQVPGQAARDLWQEYPEGREETRAMLAEAIEALRAESSQPLMLAGFSQGGMLACDMVLMQDITVAGLALMSSSCIAFAEWNARRERVDGVPSFVSHGRNDADLSFEAGQRLARFLSSSGSPVTCIPFEGGHEIPFIVWKRFKQFVQGALRAAQPPAGHARAAH